MATRSNPLCCPTYRSFSIFWRIPIYEMLVDYLVTLKSLIESIVGDSIQVRCARVLSLSFSGGFIIRFGLMKFSSYEDIGQMSTTHVNSFLLPLSCMLCLLHIFEYNAPIPSSFVYFVSYQFFVTSVNYLLCGMLRKTKCCQKPV